MSFLEELVKKGIINESQIGDIKNRAKEKHEGDLDGALSEMGVKEEEILKAKGEYFNLSLIHISEPTRPY